MTGPHHADQCPAEPQDGADQCPAELQDGADQYPAELQDGESRAAPAGTPPLDQVPPLDQESRLRRDISLVILGMVCFIGSAFRFTLTPGFEIYFAPLFYFLAYRTWGVRVGIATAFIFMLSSTFWWGHVGGAFFAALQILFVHLVARRAKLLSEGVILFYATLGGVILFSFAYFFHGVDLYVATSILIARFLNDSLCAVAVDILVLSYRFDLTRWRRLPPPVVSLSAYVRALITAFILAVVAGTYFFEIKQISSLIDEESRAISDVVRAHALADPQILPRARNEVFVPMKLREGDKYWDHANMIFLAKDKKVLFTDPFVQHFLKCHKTAEYSQIKNQDIRESVRYWVSSCEVNQITVKGNELFYIVSLKLKSAHIYEHIIKKFFFIMLVGFAISLGIRRLGAKFDRALKVWKRVVSRFGAADMKPPPHLAFEEFDGPVRQFVMANNEYMRSLAEKQRTQIMMNDLRRNIDLRLLHDVRIDLDAGQLHFSELDAETGPRTDSLPIHPADLPAFAALGDETDSLVEFRVADRADGGWFMLLLHDVAGATTGHRLRFAEGVLLRLRQPRAALSLMMQQARLIELGGMASAIGHEMKQPLFTISLAAENGLAGMERIAGDDARKVESKFQKILAQIDRARSIIDNVLRYARLDSETEGKDFVLSDALRDVSAFVRPTYMEKNVRLHLKLPETTVHLRLPRVAFEQIIVNALQNALDATASRLKDTPEPPGEVELLLHDISGGGIEICVRDNGTGLPPGVENVAFDPFFTTKEQGKGTGLGLYICRQLLAEQGGDIRLIRRESGQGAELRVILPADCVVRPESAARDQNMGESDRL